MNTSAWNTIKGKRRNPALSPAHLIVEFDRTKQPKIFNHKLGRVDFSAQKNLGPSRQTVIDKEFDNLDLNGFKFKNVGHVHSEDVISGPVAANGNEYSYPVYGHGHPLGGTEHGGMESCSRAGLQCRSGAGTNSLCQPGKCVIGTLERVTDDKWKYTSKNTYGSPARPVVYYLPAEKEVVLKTILRGNYTTYSATGEAYSIQINKPASISSRIYLPPRFYYSEDFIETAIIKTDERLRSVSKRPLIDVIGIENRKARFIQSIIVSAYPGTSEGYLNDRLYVTATEEIRDALKTGFAKLDNEWVERIDDIISEEFLYRFAKVYTGLDFLSVTYDRIKALFESIVQVTSSSLTEPKISYNKEQMARPVYSRLPGIAEAYRSDPAFSEVESVAQWLTSGADEFLSKKKDSVEAFYADYLDPDTCSPALLDWLAQHVGLFGDLWNFQWDNRIKRVMIKNSFGWWDREEKLDGVLTPKGRVLEEFPFTQEEWAKAPSQEAWGGDILGWGDVVSWDGNYDNLLKIKLDEVGPIASTIEKIFKAKNYSETTQKLSLFFVEQVRANKVLWNGLIEAKGSLLGAVFLCSVFGLKAHSPLELEIVDASKKIIRPKTGLRNAEITAPLLLPYKSEVIQVGTIADASSGNYANQLVAGISRASSTKDSQNVFFRVPYYYNRDGKSWDRVGYIAKNWMPSNLNVRVQYPYLSADLWAVGDAFFEPEIVVS